MIGVGGQFPSGVAGLLSAALDEQMTSAIRSLFARLGAHVASSFSLGLAEARRANSARD